MDRSPYWEANNSLAGQEISRILLKQKFITAFTSTRPLSLSWARSIQPAIPLLLSNSSNQTKQRRRTLIKHPVVNLLKVSSLTPVHYMQTDERKDRFVAALLSIVIAPSPKSNHSKVIILILRVFIRFAHNRSHPDSFKIDWPKPRVMTSTPSWMRL